MFTKMELEDVGVYCELTLVPNGDEFEIILLVAIFESFCGEEGITDATFNFPLNR